MTLTSFSQGPSHPSSQRPILWPWFQEPLFHTTLNPTPQLLQLRPAPPPRSEGGPAAVRGIPSLEGDGRGPGFPSTTGSWNPQWATSHLCSFIFHSVDKGEVGPDVKSSCWSQRAAPLLITFHARSLAQMTPLKVRTVISTVQMRKFSSKSNPGSLSYIWKNTKSPTYNHC